MDPYTQFGMTVDEMYADTRPVRGNVAAVMDFSLPERTFELIESPTRVFEQESIHEIICVHEDDAPLGEPVTGATYVGFVEIEAGGVVLRGNHLSIDGDPIGTVVGFDLTHAPNHMNVLCQASEPQTGSELGVTTDDDVVIE